MNCCYWSFILVGATAFAFSMVLTPACRALAWKLDFLDKPLGEKHKRHGKATPLMGGLAILAAWLLTIATGLAATRFGEAALPPNLMPYLTGIGDAMPLLLVIALGALGLGLVGLVDDRWPLGPFVKLGCQLAVAAAVTLYPNLRITLFWDNPTITWLLSVGWFVFIINAFNFFDNMDGLAAGIAAIAAALFVVVAGVRGQLFVGALGSATAGAALGFYCYNRSPASIFMGDAGSHVLGYLLAALGALTIFYDPGETQSVAAILIPLFILALPIFDTFAVVIIRLRLGKAIYHGDHNHISHRFVKMGVTRKTAVLVVHLLAVSLGLGALPMLWLDDSAAWVVLAQAAAMLALVSILHQIEAEPKPKEKTDEQAETEPTGAE